MAHELGHYMLHSEEPAIFVDNAFVTFRTEAAGGSSGDPREIEANEFAACILMPGELLTADVVRLGEDHVDEAAVSQLARQYEVSEQAMAIRLTRLGLLV